MLLLAIETSSRLGSLVLHDGTDIVATRGFAHGLQNAARILPLLDEMCRERGVTPQGITDVAVSVGPGSFTGLRIGVTLAKGLCFATGAKLLAVPSLPVIALNAPSHAANIMPILDAKRDQVFGAVYRRVMRDPERGMQHDAFDEVSAPQLARLTDLLARTPRPLMVIGEGIRFHQQHLASQISAPEIQIVVAPETLWYPKAATVAHLALILKQQGAYADPFRLTPIYIRKPEAQERMEAGLLKHLES